MKNDAPPHPKKTYQVVVRDLGEEVNDGATLQNPVAPRSL